MANRAPTALEELENRLLEPLLQRRRADWLLEIAPSDLASARPGPAARRLEVRDGCIVRPFQARLDELPLDSDSVPVILLRHLWRPGDKIDPLVDVVRVLRPGGLLLSVSLDPWHLRAWRCHRLNTVCLPGRWRLRRQHRRHGLNVEDALASSGSRWLAAPVLVLVARKHVSAGRVLRLRFGGRRIARSPALPTQCRAA